MGTWLIHICWWQEVWRKIVNSHLLGWTYNPSLWGASWRKHRKLQVWKAWEVHLLYKQGAGGRTLCFSPATKSSPSRQFTSSGQKRSEAPPTLRTSPFPTPASTPLPPVGNGRPAWRGMWRGQPQQQFQPEHWMDKETCIQYLEERRLWQFPHWLSSLASFGGISVASSQQDLFLAWVFLMLERTILASLLTIDSGETGDEEQCKTSGFSLFSASNAGPW